MTAIMTTPRMLHLPAIALVVTLVFSLADHAMALAGPDEVYEDYMYVHCLKEAFKTVERDVVDHTRAFDPGTGRNFVYDKDKEEWIDTKTGEVICPKNGPSKKAAAYEDYLYVHCLKEEFKTVERDIVDHARAFDPGTGRNFHYDKDKEAWIDSKTGEQVCPPPTTSKTKGGMKTASADSSVPAQDKSHYNLFNMTPPGLRRPFYTDYGALSPYTIDAGAYAADVSFGYGYRERSGDMVERTYTSWHYGNMWLKAGLLNNLDLEVGIQPWQTRTLTVKDPTGHDSITRSGFGDLLTRVKYNVWGNDSGPSAFSVAGTIKWPTASEALVRHDNYEGGLSAQFGYQCPCGLQLRVNSGFMLSESDRGCWESCFDNRIAFYHPIVGNLSALAAFNSDVSTARRSDWEGEFQTGFIYQPTPNFQIFIGSTFGVNGMVNDFGPSVSMDLRFP